MFFGRNKAVYGILIFTVILFAGFYENGFYWENGNAKQFAENDGSQSFPQDKFVTEFNSAAQKWSNQGSYFSFPNPLVDDSDSVDPVWSFSHLDGKNGLYWTSLGYDPFGNPVLASAYLEAKSGSEGPLQETDIALSYLVDWSDYGGDQNRFDIQSVALHELGHSLGLGHPQGDIECGSSDPVMEEFLSKSDDFNSLKCDDKEGLEEVYENAPPPPPPCAPCCNSSIASIAKIPQSHRLDASAILNNGDRSNEYEKSLKSATENNQNLSEIVNDFVTSHEQNLTSDEVELTKQLVDDLKKVISKYNSEISEGVYQNKNQVINRLEVINDTLGTFVGSTLENAKGQLLRDESIVESRLELEGNAPNPFSATTEITYALKKATRVTIEVYDVTGRRVRTVLNERQVAGPHRVQFNANGLSSGTYIYRVEAGKVMKSGKMTVMR